MFNVFLIFSPLKEFLQLYSEPLCLQIAYNKAVKKSSEAPKALNHTAALPSKSPKFLETAFRFRRNPLFRPAFRHDFYDLALVRRDEDLHEIPGFRVNRTHKEDLSGGNPPGGQKRPTIFLT